MVQDAEENAEKDKSLKAKVEGRNKLESYLYNVKSSMSEEAFQANLSSESKTMLSEVVNDGLKWLDATDMDQSSAEDFAEKLKEVEAVVTPIMTQVYQQQQSTTAGTTANGSNGEEDSPTVEEVD